MDRLRRWGRAPGQWLKFYRVWSLLYPRYEAVRLASEFTWRSLSPRPADPVLPPPQGGAMSDQTSPGVARPDIHIACFERTFKVEAAPIESGTIRMSPATARALKFWLQQLPKAIYLEGIGTTTPSRSPEAKVVQK